MRRFVVSSLVIVLAIAATIGLAVAQPGGFQMAPGANGPASQRVAHVYLLRGLADIFSTGMDGLADKLRRHGIRAQVANHASADTFAAEVAQLYRAGSRAPVIIAGHSLGADGAVVMAQRLHAYGVPVALVVTFGPLGNQPVPANVSRAINYYQANSAWSGRMVRGPGFRGSLANVNLDNVGDVTHFNIEKVDRIQNQAVANIMAAIGARRRADSRRPAAAGEAKIPGLTN